ncbi:MAG TPA: TonB family protein [Steroidobacteraceae bacterium]|nr:TonB family protein [Steroidobacteraceae bacterium]
MSATTVNAFPPLHAFSSSRSWFIALIVLVHVGFFYALSNGLTIPIFKAPPQGPIFVPIDVPKPPPKPTAIDVHPVVGIFTPVVQTPQLTVDDPHAPVITTTEPPPPPVVLTQEGPGSAPLIVGPQLDTRYPFTEPPYPTSEIRMGHEGTVLLRMQILPNGRIGAVELAQSSGFPRLDEAAMREARMWRMKPGTQGGVATAMWTVVPIKFQLKN